jgi:dihydropteroate synthase
MPAIAGLAGIPVGGDHPVAVGGVLNVSPESFYAGSVHRVADDLRRAAFVMVEAGAALVDVGARSTAPYLHAEIPEAEECERLGAAVETLAGKVPVPISADTTRARAAQVALDAGARIVNDVSGLRDPAMAGLVRARGASVILMASPDGTALGEPVASVRRFLAESLARARAAGIPDDRIVLDPGIGFFREGPVRWDQWDVEVLARLGELAELGRPLGIGVSRKSFLGAIAGREGPGERLAASLAATTAAVLVGAALIRTHDVAETLDAVRVAERLRRAGSADHAPIRRACRGGD